MEAAKILAGGLPFEEGRALKAAREPFKVVAVRLGVQGCVLRVLASFNSPACGTGLKSCFSSDFGGFSGFKYFCTRPDYPYNHGVIYNDLNRHFQTEPPSIHTNPYPVVTQS